MQIDKIENINAYIDFNLHKSIRCNITGYITLKSEFEKEYVKKYFENYSKEIQYKKQNKKNTKDIEAYLFELKVPNEMFYRENIRNKKYRKYIDQLKVELWEEDTPYVVFLDRRGKSTYLQFLICDRFYYPKGKQIKSKKVCYKDKETGKFKSKKEFLEDKEDKIAIHKGKEQTIYSTDKVRQPYIHYSPNREKEQRILGNFIFFIKSKIITIKNRLLKNQNTKEQTLVKKKENKVLKKISSKTIRVNDKFKEFELIDSYQRRRIKSYNKVANLINHLSSQNSDLKEHLLEDYISLLKDIKGLKINEYEAEIEGIYNDLILLIGT